MCTYSKRILHVFYISLCTSGGRPSAVEFLTLEFLLLHKALLSSQTGHVTTFNMEMYHVFLLSAHVGEVSLYLPSCRRKALPHP